jgi:exosortase A
MFRALFPFLIASACWLVLFFESIQSMVGVWSHSKTYEHGFLIPLISIWLIWRLRSSLHVTNIRISKFAIALLPFPALLWLVGQTASISFFEHIALVLSFQLILWATLGKYILRVIWFPTFFLLFCIPFGEELIPYLQNITADLSVYYLQIVGIPVYREGLYIYIPNGTFEVAEACSGIRFLISSVALGTLFAYLNFSKLWKGSCFVAFSFVFPIFANSLRAFGIILIGYLSNMEHAVGADHLIYGWLFFSIVMLCIFYVAGLFADNPSLTPPSSANSVPTPTTFTQYSSLAVIIVLFSSVAIWKSTLHQESTLAADIHLPSTTFVPLESQAVSDWGVSYPDAQISRVYHSSNQLSTIFVARYQIGQPNGELISFNNRLYDDSIWTQESQQSVQLDKTSSATLLTLKALNGNTLRLLYWYCIDGYCSSNASKIKLKEASLLLSNKKSHGDLYAISTQLESVQSLVNYAGDLLSNEPQ